MNTLKAFWEIVGNYRQGIFASILSLCLFAPFYVAKIIELETVRVQEMSETVDILEEAQKLFIHQENEMHQMKEYINQQGAMINQLINEIRKLRGLPIPKPPSRSEA